MKSGLFLLILLATICAMCVSVASGQNEKKASSSPANRSASQPSAPAVSKLKMPGPEVQNLMLGTWAIKADYAPSKEAPNGVTGEGIEVWRPGPGGYSIVEAYHEKNARGEIYGFVPFWWDADLQGLRFLWCDSTNPRGCELSKYVAKWESNRLVYREDREDNGKKITHQEVFEDITPASFSQILSEGPAGSRLKRVLTIRAAKILETSMKPAEGYLDAAELPVVRAESVESSTGTARCVVDYAPQSPDEAELVRIERDWCVATIDRDATKLDRILADDLSWIEDTGYRNKAQVMRRFMTGSHEHAVELKDVRIRMFGNVAVVSSHAHVKKTVTGTLAESDHATLDVFEKRAGRWQLVVE